MIYPEAAPTGQAARTFAYAAHLLQKYGDANYIVHLDHAAQVIHRFWPTSHPSFDVLVTAAYLHDTLEDTRAQPHDIALLFGAEVARLVQAVTDRPGKNRAERHDATHPVIAAAGELAIAVKLADRIANVETALKGPNPGMLKMYRKEWRVFRRDLFNPEHSPYLQHMWGHLTALMEEG